MPMTNEWNRVRRVAYVASLLWTAACTTADEKPTAGRYRTDSAGVRTTTFRTPEWSETARWRIDTVVQLRVDSEQHGSTAPFRWFVSPVLLEDGGVAFATESTELRWYDESGQIRVQRSVKGQGPGEFTGLVNIRVLAGDTLELSDFMGRTVAKYDRTGVLAGEHTVELSALHALGNWAECATRLWPGGYRTACAEDTTIPNTGTNKLRRRLANGLTSPGDGLYRPLRRTWLLTPALDAALPLGIEGGIEQYGVAGAGFFMHPFYSRSLLEAGGTPFRVYSMRNPEYEIAVWDSAGRLVQQWRLNGTRHVATEADRAAAFAWMMQQEQNGRNRDWISAAIRKVEASDTLPAAVSMHLAATGELLVQRALPPSSPDSTRTDVFHPEGRWLGTLVSPPRSRIAQLTRDRVLLLRTNDDDVLTLEVRRLFRSR